ncbi:MAG: phage capsid protein, partial [Clostridia bacterium]|nr:phage capsid protein [Clostridia bacterium]
MPNLNYAEVWEKELLDILIQETLTSPFITQNVKFLDAKTFHFTQMSTSGYKPHSRNGGWNTGSYAQTDVPFTLTHDRDIEFLIDKADVDETNSTASIQNISMTFEKTQASPEADALFFSKVAQTAQATQGYSSITASSAYTKANVFSNLKTFLNSGKLRRYKANGSLIMYVSSLVMDLLEQSTEFTRKIEMTQIAEGGLG